MIVYSLISNGTSIFAGTNAGIYRSTDNGVNWLQVNNGLSNLTVVSFLLNGTTLYAGTADGIYNSTNNGNTWTRNPGLINVMPNSIILANNTIYAGSGSGIYFSIDNGATWTRMTNAPTANIFNLAVLNGSTIFAGTNGIFRSTDYGANWTKVNNALGNSNVISLLSKGSIIYAGSQNGGGIYNSTDNGNNWTQLNNIFISLSIQSLYSDGTYIYSGTSGGVYRSLDNGSTWNKINNGLNNYVAMTFLYDGSSTFCGTNGGGIFKLGIANNVPSIISCSSSNIGQNTATLNGIVNPNGVSTTVKFEYGTTISYGSVVEASQSPISGNSNINVSANITGLTPNTLFHYRVEATNNAGTSNGFDSTFKTLQTPVTLFYISGKITDSYNYGISNVSINLSGQQIASTQTDINGNYIFNNLLNGNYQIVPIKNDYIFTPDKISLTIQNDNVTNQNFTTTKTLSPNWYYTNTGISHVILIPLSSNPNINNAPLLNGDYIGVFYDSLGTLACGGYAVWNGTLNVSLTAWGNDQSPSSPDGFASGEAFKWKIWRASDKKTFDAVAAYSTDVSFTNTDKFAANGLSGLTKLAASLLTQQQITLNAGWQLISSYIQPVSSNLDSMFQQIKTDLIIMKDGSGNVYWPAFGVNSIVNWQSILGYQIKMQNNRVLNITGNQITPETTNISLPQGWSMIGYLRSAPMAVDTALNSITNNIIIVKNGKGQVYWPAYGINSIGNMNPGEGYQIKLTSAANLLYPANYGPVSPPNGLTYQNKISRNYKSGTAKVTDNNAVVLFQNKILNNILQPGDEIGIFDNNGLLCGSGIYEGKNLVITVYGDDNSTKEKDGFLPGEKFEVKIYSKKLNKEFNPVNVTWLNDDGSYKVNGIDIVSSLSINKYKFNGNAELEVLTNYPNPFNPTTTVAYNLIKTQIIKISVYNILGQLVKTIYNEVQTEGEHQIEVNGYNLSSGIYEVVFRTADSFKIIKINLIK